MAANANFPISQASKVSGLWPSLHALLDEGSLFLMSSTRQASGQAAGTAIATTTSVVDDAATASATHAQNVPVMYVSNGSTSGDPNGMTIYPLALRMTVVQVPTSATAWKFALRADNTPRYTSGGTALNAINLATGSSRTSVASAFFGAVLTTPLPSVNARLLASGTVQPSIPVAGDQWLFTFGDITMPSSILTASAGKNINVPLQPFSLAPSWNFVLEMWGASNAAAPSWEFDFLYAERQSGL